MNLKNKAKKTIKKKTRKLVIKAIKPFLPFIIIILGLIFAFCTIIDAIFIQEVQVDASEMPQAQREIREKCIEKSEFLNTCHNYKDGELTNYLLDINSLEIDKEVEWSHLYAIMAFHNMTDFSEINEDLLNEVAREFESTFIYETSTIKTETKSIDENGEEIINTSEETLYLLIESNTITGHYKYNYQEIETEKDNIKTTKKVFTNEELLSESYERLRNYLRYKLNIQESYIETDLNIVIQAANGYYEGEENTNWLQGSEFAQDIITDGKGLIPKDMFIWPIPGYTNITSHFRNENAPNNWSI